MKTLERSDQGTVQHHIADETHVNYSCVFSLSSLSMAVSSSKLTIQQVSRTLTLMPLIAQISWEKFNTQPCDLKNRYIHNLIVSVLHVYGQSSTTGLVQRLARLSYLSHNDIATFVSRELQLAQERLEYTLISEHPTMRNVRKCHNLD